MTKWLSLMVLCLLVLALACTAASESPEITPEAVAHVTQVTATRPPASSTPIPTNTTPPTATPRPPDTATAPPTNTPRPTDTATAPPTNTPRPTDTRRPTSTTKPADLIVAADTLNMRSGPGTNYAALTAFKQGDELTITGVNADHTWVRAQAGGFEGWVLLDLCDCNRNLDQVNVIAVAPPTPVPQPTAPPTATLPPAPTAPPEPPTAVPQPTNPPAPAAVCNCTGPDLNCSDFGSHASAQACFDYCVSLGYGDIFRLDGNNDGDACESLP